MAVSDVTPPSATIVTSSEVQDSEGGGCCGGDRRWIQLELTATDEATPSHRMGYKLTVLGGDPPANFPATQTLRHDNVGYLLVYVDVDDGEFAFDLEIRAVDLNGNEGPPVVVEIERRDDSGGCTTSSDLPWWALLVVGAIAFTLVRRRSCRRG